ncbi:MAG: DUF2442 domain-containing protein [Bacteroidota bacterium]|nr:DUF2442 domain-containing protein [Bacteroidota bacterium]
MIISVTKAEYIKDYFIMLNFDNGKKGMVDLKATIFDDKRKIFEPLRNVDYFKKFTLGSWTLNWENELDLSPEYLYDLAMKKS